MDFEFVSAPSKIKKKFRNIARRTMPKVILSLDSYIGTESCEYDRVQQNTTNINNINNIKHVLRILRPARVDSFGFFRPQGTTGGDGDLGVGVPTAFKRSAVPATTRTRTTTTTKWGRELSVRRQV
jgi:hypothetical protein